MPIQTLLRCLLLATFIAFGPSAVHASEPDKKSGLVDTVLSWFTGEKPDSPQNSNAWAEILAILETAKS